MREVLLFFNDSSIIKSIKDPLNETDEGKSKKADDFFSDMTQHKINRLTES